MKGHSRFPLERVVVFYLCALVFVKGTHGYLQERAVVFVKMETFLGHVDARGEVVAGFPPHVGGTLAVCPLGVVEKIEDFDF